MDVLVHRGIYEYDQFMPEIMEQLQRFGDKARQSFNLLAILLEEASHFWST
ncbi:hypothetical protein P3S68_010966 [Capsicum galapagoense]